MQGFQKKRNNSCTIPLDIVQYTQDPGQNFNRSKHGLCFFWETLNDAVAFHIFAICTVYNPVDYENKNFITQTNYPRHTIVQSQSNRRQWVDQIGNQFIIFNKSAGYSFILHNTLGTG